VKEIKVCHVLQGVTKNDEIEGLFRVVGMQRLESFVVREASPGSGPRDINSDCLNLRVELTGMLKQRAGPTPEIKNSETWLYDGWQMKRDVTPLDLNTRLRRNVVQGPERIVVV
jgi:hypothetical protein